MHGLLAILVFILVFFLVIALVVGKFVYKVFKLVHKTKKAAEGFANNMNDTSAYGFNSKDYTGNSNKSKNDTVMDTRDPSIAKRKIFSPKEGEYVKFEEES